MLKSCWLIITTTKRDLSAVIDGFVKVNTTMSTQRENQMLGISRKERKTTVQNSMITPQIHKLSMSFML